VEKIIKFFYQHGLLVLIILIGGFFRFYRLPETLQFLGDQGRDALVWLRIFTEKDLPFIGPITSVGNFYLGPLYYYLMAPWLWLFNFDPVGPAYVNAFIGLITIPALYFVSLKMFSHSVGLIASFLYAFGSIPVLQTRGAWNPNPMPLVALGIIYSLYQLVIKRQKKWLLGLTFFLVIALQLHYIILFLFPFLGWQFIRLPKKSFFNRYFWWSVAILIIFNLPLILFEVKNNFVNLKGLVYYFQSSGYNQFNLFQKLRDINGRSEEAIGLVLGFGQAYSLLRLWITRIILIGIILILIKFPSRPLTLLVQYLFISILALVFYRGSMFPHYLGFLYPAVFLLVGLILSKFPFKLIFIPLIFIGLFLKVNLGVLKTELIDSRGNLATVKLTASRIAADLDKHNYPSFNLVLIDGTHDYRAMNFRYFLELNGKKALDVNDYSNAVAVYVISPYPQVDVTNIPIWEIKSTWPSRETEKWEFKDSENIYKIEKI